MFRRLQETIRMLRKPSENPFTKPDVVFVEELELRVSRVSKAIGGFIEALVLVLVAGYAGSSIAGLFPKQTGFSVGTLAGITAALLSLFGIQLSNNLNRKLQLHLKIGQQIAPYFGHRLEQTYRTLKG